MRRQKERLPGKFALTKELWIIVFIKLLVIFALWQLFFADPASHHIKTDEAVAAHLYSKN